MPAFQFNVEIDGIAAVTRGIALEWMLPPTFFIAPLGIVTRGLLVGLGDEWRYSDTSASPSWALSDSSTNPGWTVSG